MFLGGNTCRSVFRQCLAFPEGNTMNIVKIVTHTTVFASTTQKYVDVLNICVK